MRWWAPWFALGAVAAHAATVGVAVAPGVGLEDLERESLRQTLDAALIAQGAATAEVKDIADGCAADPACASAAAQQAGVDVLVVLEVMRVGDDAEATESLVGRDGVVWAQATESTLFATLAHTPLLPAVQAGVQKFVATARPAPPAQAPGDGRAGVGLALRADGALLHARTLGVTIDTPSLRNALTGDGLKGAGGGVLVQVSWMAPLPGSTWNRAVGVEADVGYQALPTQGTIPFSQYQTRDGQTVLVTTNYVYDSIVHVVPVTLGVRSRLPLPALPVRIDLSAGGAGLWGLSVAQARVDGADVAFAVDNAASDIAWGFYLEAGVAWSLGPGELCAGYRYLSAYLDFEHPAQNPGPGDLGGHHLLVGYRFTL
jgi:hypothetical protein